jgi:hypothetical protein
MKRWLVLLPTLALLAALVACAGPDPGAPPDAADVATAVAATQGAQAIPQPAQTAPSPDGATPAATNPDEPASPANSASLRVVYTSDQNAWITGEAGPPLRLSDSGDVYDVRITSDGSLVVYARRPALDGPTELWSVGADGTDPRQLLAAADWNSLYDPADFRFNDLGRMDFIPGTHLLLLNTRAVPEGPGLFLYDDLLRLDADSGALERLLAPGEGGGFLPSPDGKKVALIRPTSIGIVNADGGEPHQECITYPTVITYSEYLYYPKPVWSDDSSRLGVALPSPDPLAPGLSGTIWDIEAEPCVGRPLGTLAGDFFFSQFSAPSLSPDLRQVAFARPGEDPTRVDLLTAAADGSGQEVFAAGNLSWQGWAPDSDRFVYTEEATTDLMLGQRGQVPMPLATGHDLRWISETAYLFLSRIEGGWALMRGMLPGPASMLATASGETVAYDFAGE